MTDELTRLRQLNASLTARVAAQAAVLNDRAERARTIECADALGHTDFEREQGPLYAAELDKAAAILQSVHPIGQYKAIGRLEVVAALCEVIGQGFQRRPANEDEAFASDDLCQQISELVCAAIDQLPTVMRLKKYRDIVGCLAAKAAALGWDAAVMADGQADTPGQ